MIYVVSEHVGEIGGGAKSPLLLCEALRSMGHEITLFVLSPPTRGIEKRLTGQDIRIRTTALRVGSRYHLPQRMLAFQVYLNAILERPTVLCIYSLSTLTRYILQYPLPLGVRVYAWECTEAIAGIKFLDESVSKYLHKVSAVLAPAQIIEINLRQTYQYDGEVKFLPFWVESPPKPLVFPRKRSQQFLFLGRYDTDKGISFLLEAFKTVHTHFPSATLRFCGSGDLSLFRELTNIPPNIQICGAATGADFEKAFEHSVALILPSLHEGYPLCLFEACARGVPIIATSVGSIPEIFGDKCFAQVVAPCDIGALISAMERVLSLTNSDYEYQSKSALSFFSKSGSIEGIKPFLQELFS